MKCCCRKVAIFCNKNEHERNFSTVVNDRTVKSRDGKGVISCTFLHALVVIFRDQMSKSMGKVLCSRLSLFHVALSSWIKQHLLQLQKNLQVMSQSFFLIQFSLNCCWDCPMNVLGELHSWESICYFCLLCPHMLKCHWCEKADSHFLACCQDMGHVFR